MQMAGCLVSLTGMFTGDTLFTRKIGRLDFPGGDEAVLRRSIPEYPWHPGHFRLATILELQDWFWSVTVTTAIMNCCLNHLFTNPACDSWSLRLKWFEWPGFRCDILILHIASAFANQLNWIKLIGQFQYLMFACRLQAGNSTQIFRDWEDCVYWIEIWRYSWLVVCIVRLSATQRVSEIRTRCH
jgi:hypothetical protein